MKGEEIIITTTSGYTDRVLKIKSRFNKKMGANEKVTTQVKPNPVDDPQDINGYVYWGDTNDFPSENWDMISQSGLPQRIFDDLVRIHFGAGLYYFTEEIRDEKIVRIPVINKDVNEWLENNLIAMQIQTHIRDFYVWKQGAVEFVVDQINHKILKCKVHDVSFVRWGYKNESGIVDKAFLSSEWPSPSTALMADLPAINPLDPDAIFKSNKNKTNFIYPMVSLTPTRLYYPHPAWCSDDIADWIESSLLTPIFHQSLLENAATVSFTLYFHDQFWPQRYPDWENMDAKAKTAAKKATIDSVTASLSGAEKAGKFIVSGYVFDDQGNEIKGLKIEAVKQELHDQAFMMSNAQADSEIAYALGFDPSLMGHGMPGGKELSGSGSEKMRSLQNRQLLMAGDRVFTLNFLNFVSKYNKWGVKFGYLDNTPTTLDKSQDGLTPKQESNVN